MTSTADSFARLFIGLWPDSATRDALHACERRWVWSPRAVPVLRERLHLTLHFLGAVPRERVAGLVDGLDVGFDPFELTLEQAEVWHGGVAVLRSVDVPPALQALHARLHAALDTLQQPSVREHLLAHVTLARHAQGARPPARFTPIRWCVDGYALIESERRPPASYRVLQAYPRR
jgi:2'-5' RNA ligase